MVCVDTPAATLELAEELSPTVDCAKGVGDEVADLRCCAGSAKGLKGEDAMVHSCDEGEM